MTGPGIGGIVHAQIYTIPIHNSDRERIVYVFLNCFFIVMMEYTIHRDSLFSGGKLALSLVFISFWDKKMKILGRKYFKNKVGIQCFFVIISKSTYTSLFLILKWICGDLKLFSNDFVTNNALIYIKMPFKNRKCVNFQILSSLSLLASINVMPLRCVVYINWSRFLCTLIDAHDIHCVIYTEPQMSA